jgi:hypothetical protein
LGAVFKDVLLAIVACGCAILCAAFGGVARFTFSLWIASVCAAGCELAAGTGVVGDGGDTDAAAEVAGLLAMARFAGVGGVFCSILPITTTAITVTAAAAPKPANHFFASSPMDVTTQLQLWKS